MKTFLELAATRCSVRNYSSKPLPQETIEYILECARLAPSAVNFQPWKLYLITPDSPKALREGILKCYDREWIKTAPYFLIAVIDHETSWHRRNDGKDHGDIDIAILTEHICLSASEQGIGTCWVCNFNAELCKEVLQLGEAEEAAVLIPFGYPAEEWTPAEKKRKGMDEILVKL